MNNKDKLQITSKLELAYYDLIKKDSFNKRITELRLKHGVPEDGYELKINEEILANLPPQPWLDAGNLKNVEYKKLKDDLYILRKDYGFHAINDKLDPFLFYLFYNKGIKFQDKAWYDIGYISTEELFNLPEEEKQEFLDTYPLLIALTPNLTLRDFIDYLKLVFKNEIKPFLDKYISKGSIIGKVKTKKNDHLINYIWEKKDLNRKQLAREVNQLFKTKYNYSDINTLIHQEAKRRKDV